MMSDEIKKPGYCRNCSKNVPHCRQKWGRFQKTLGLLLYVLRIGPWYCLHCQRKKLFRPSVRSDAADYRIVQPSDPVDPGKPAIWSLSCSGDENSNSFSDLAVVGGGLNNVHETANSIDRVYANPVQQSTNGVTWESGSGVVNLGVSQLEAIHQEAAAFKAQFDVEEIDLADTDSHDPDFSYDDDYDDEDYYEEDYYEEDYYQDVEQDVFNGDLAEALPLEIVDEANGAISVATTEEQPNSVEAVEMPTESQQSPSEVAPEIIEAEAVNKYIKEQMARIATPIYRFTEKYRDSVVDRILAGKITISTLISDGMFTEAELVSWIADKTKRQKEKIETLEYDSDPRRNEQGRQSNYGPFGPR